MEGMRKIFAPVERHIYTPRGNLHSVDYMNQEVGLPFVTLQVLSAEGNGPLPVYFGYNVHGPILCGGGNSKHNLAIREGEVTAHFAKISLPYLDRTKITKNAPIPRGNGPKAHLDALRDPLEWFKGTGLKDRSLTGHIDGFNFEVIDMGGNGPTEASYRDLVGKSCFSEELEAGYVPIRAYNLAASGYVVSSNTVKGEEPFYWKKDAAIVTFQRDSEMMTLANLWRWEKVFGGSGQNGTPEAKDTINVVSSVPKPIQFADEIAFQMASIREQLLGS